MLAARTSSTAASFRPKRQGIRPEEAVSLAIRAVIVLALAPVAPAARAYMPTQAHQRSTLPGVRAAALGGAYAALADDPTGGYYNPAGMAFAKESSLSVSANAFHRSTLTYEKALSGDDFSEHTQSIYPSFAGSLNRFGPFAVGYSYLTLDSREIDQADRFENVSEDYGNLQTYSRTHQETQKSVGAGVSASLKLGGRLSVGLSQFGYYRSFSASTHQLAELNGGGLLIADTKYEGKNMGLLTVAGLMARLGPMSIGLVGRFPQAISDEAVVHTDVIYEPPGDTVEPEIGKTDVDSTFFEEMMPRTYQLGLAWLPGRAFTLSTEVLYHEGIANSDPDSVVPPLEPMLNYSVGVEAKLAKLAVRLGAFTDNSMTLEPVEGEMNQPTHVDFIGLSGGLGIETKQYDIGVTLTKKAGKGKAQIISGRDTTQNVKAESESLVLGGRYSF
jgi:long-chain fatty acid transport protein